MKRKSEESKEQAQDGSKMPRREHDEEEFLRRRRKRMIHIEFVDTNRGFEVARPAGSYLSTMGVPGSKGLRHKLYPEETLYLRETGAAYVTDKAGNELTTAQLHGIALNLVPHTHFTAYREIRRSGFVIVRKRFDPSVHGLPTTSTASSALSEEVAETPAERVQLKPFPRRLLDDFPMMIREGQLEMKNLAADDALNPVGHAVEANLPLSPTLLRFSSLAGRKDAKRLARRLAPGYWPNLEHIARTATDWADYRKRALAAINNAREMRTRNSAR
ncbi:unnamed protein product, partial [Mesorhabditis spiculigera]